MTEQKRLGGFKLGDFMLEYLVLIIIVLLAIVTAIVEPNFLSSQNFTNLMRQFGPLSFVALGMTFIILGGFIDLSVPGTISLVAMITLSLVDTIGEAPAMLLGLALGAFLGCVNGTILVNLGANIQAKALFITYGFGQIYGACALYYTSGTSMNRTFINHPMPITQALSTGAVGPLSVSFIVFLVFLAGLYIFQTRTSLGRYITYTGGNLVASELGGLPTKRIMVMIYTICGFMAAVCAIVLFSRVSVATPTFGRGYERDAIMAVVVGGTSLLGGRGSVLRTFLGVALVVLLSNCMNLLGIQTNMQDVLKGAVLVVAIWLDHRRASRR